MEKIAFHFEVITKYVDDLFAIIKETEIERTLAELNIFHDSIKFTMELEETQKLPYLDILITKNGENLFMDWYQKNTASGRIMNFFSKHPKRIILNTTQNLIHRVLSISDQRFHQKNKKKLQSILEENNFPKKLSRDLIADFKPRTEKLYNDKQQKSYRSLLYIPGISERISKSNIFDRNKYNLAHKSNNTLKKLFTNTKDKIQKEETPNVIYEIPCEGNSSEKCEMVYIGTKKKLKTRISGHKSDIKSRNNQKLQKTALATHCAKKSHHPNFNNVRILQQESNNNKRYTLEMLHINNVPTNRRINYKTDTDSIAHIYRHMICKNDDQLTRNNPNNNIRQPVQ
ncbi:uncharacterized protein LOC142231219 [Haematobia irritans]|uniref:uncharacterized protein LOC142231219 n=1 Tax=Haematobia irritans TaxID=7368 RepID=UPI003F4FFEB8